MLNEHDIVLNVIPLNDSAAILLPLDFKDDKRTPGFRYVSGTIIWFHQQMASLVQTAETFNILQACACKVIFLNLEISVKFL